MVQATTPKAHWSLHPSPKLSLSPKVYLTQLHLTNVYWAPPRSQEVTLYWGSVCEWDSGHAPEVVIRGKQQQSRWPPAKQCAQKHAYDPGRKGFSRNNRSRVWRSSQCLRGLRGSELRQACEGRGDRRGAALSGSRNASVMAQRGDAAVCMRRAGVYTQLQVVTPWEGGHSLSQTRGDSGGWVWAGHECPHARHAE